MQRVNLGKPYEEFIHKLVASGYYASASEVLRDALRLKMEQSQQWQTNRLQQLVQEGLDDIAAGRVVEFSEEMLDTAFENARINALNGKEIVDHIKPLK